MSNVLFPSIDVPRLSSWMFNGLRGLQLPSRASSSYHGSIGVFIDSFLKTSLNITNVNSTVDLEKYKIEVKSKEIGSKADWTIGTMTLNDIIKTPYRQSTVYQKLQALLLINTNDDFQIITDFGLYYLDFDEVQVLLEESYEGARTQLQARVAIYANNIASLIADGQPNAILKKLEFSSFESFQGNFGKFEFTNNGTSFAFRISVPQMRHLTTLAATQTQLIEFV